MKHGLLTPMPDAIFGLTGQRPSDNLAAYILRHFAMAHPENNRASSDVRGHKGRSMSQCCAGSRNLSYPNTLGSGVKVQSLAYCRPFGSTRKGIKRADVGALNMPLVFPSVMNPRVGIIPGCGQTLSTDSVALYQEFCR